MTKKKNEETVASAEKSAGTKPKAPKKTPKKAAANKSAAKSATKPAQAKAEPSDAAPESANLGRELSTGTGGGFIVLLGEAPDSSGGDTLPKHEERVLDLGTMATISNVADLHAHALLLMKTEAPIDILSAEVERVDTAVLQLLCSLCSDAAERGVDVGWDKPSVAFSHAVNQLGLNSELCGS